MNLQAVCFLNDEELKNTISIAYNIIFEGVDYVISATSFANSIVRILQSLSLSDIKQSYIGMSKKYNSPVFEFNQTFHFMPNKIPLNIIIQTLNPNNIGAMDGTLQKPTIVLYGDGFNDFDGLVNYIKSSFDDKRKILVHELIHIFDLTHSNKKAYQKPSIQSLKNHINTVLTKNQVDEIDTDILRYLNTPTEFNARVLAAITDAVNSGMINSFDEFKNYVLEDEFIKVGFLEHNNPTKFTENNYKRLLKLLYKVYNSFNVEIK